MPDQISIIPILDFPAEIRNNIYDLIVHDYCISKSFCPCYGQLAVPVAKEEDPESTHCVFSLLYASRQLYAEVGSRFTCSLRFRVLSLRDDDLPKLTRRLEQASEDCKGCLVEWQDHLRELCDGLTGYMNNPSFGIHETISLDASELWTGMHWIVEGDGAAEAEIEQAKSMRDLLQLIEALISRVMAMEEIAGVIDCGWRIRRWAPNFEVPQCAFQVDEGVGDGGQPKPSIFLTNPQGILDRTRQRRGVRPAPFDGSLTRDRVPNLILQPTPTAGPTVLFNTQAIRMAATGPQRTNALPGTVNTPLPPSIEKAYYRKCIELKQRMTEVEKANDAVRLRKVRLERAITKMRLERAILLERLKEQTDHTGNDSEEEETPPPELQERPIRHKRSRVTPPVQSPKEAQAQSWDEQSRVHGQHAFDVSHYSNIPTQANHHHSAPYQQYDAVANAYVVPSQHQRLHYEPRKSEDQGLPSTRRIHDSEMLPSTGGFTAVNR